MNHAHYREGAEIVEVVERFERCEFGLEEFTHARHITVAAWYLCHLPPEQALERMRAGLVRFIGHHGRHGYHETITRFWMEMIGTRLGRSPAHTTITQKVNEAVDRHGNKDIIFEYYTRDRVLSERAKREWTEPDLKPIAHDQQITPLHSLRRSSARD